MNGKFLLWALSSLSIFVAGVWGGDISEWSPLVFSIVNRDIAMRRDHIQAKGKEFMHCVFIYYVYTNIMEN